jgi:hypothetical protein
VRSRPGCEKNACYRQARQQEAQASAAERGDLLVTGDARDLRALAHSVRGVTVEAL